MKTIFRNYVASHLFNDDYNKVRNFLIALDSHNYHFGRFDWMLSLFSFFGDKDGLSKIGLWEKNGSIIGMASYDCELGSAFLLALNEYNYLKEEMLLYAKEGLSKNGKIRVLVLDGDLQLQDIAIRNGFSPTQDKECDAVFQINTKNLNYVLPEGFRITSIKETPDYYQYGQVLWKGFDHEANGEGIFSPTEEDMIGYRLTFERPNVDLALKIAVVAPNGDFVSYCGMWQDTASQSVLVEPVATDPSYRKMGLGRAAVLEALKRCGERGATRAFVGSSQQFYYNIGFTPYASSTWWEQKTNI